MTIRLYRVPEMPQEAPAALFTDGEDVVVLVQAEAPDPAWIRETVNSLFGAAFGSAASPLSVVG